MAKEDFNTTAGSHSERIMPQNLDAERAVLAAAILNPDVLQELIPMIHSPQVFYRPAHQKIYESIMELFERSIPVDQLSLAERLAARGELEEVGGKPYIIELANNSFALANWRTHVDIVVRCSLLRDLIAASTKITAMGYEAPDDTDEVVEDAERLIFAVTERKISKGFQSMESMLLKTVSTLDDLAENKKHIIGVPTGFTDLDKILAGLRGGSLIVIAARPGVGKTSFALNVGVNAAKRGNRVALFSLEMAAEEIIPRILSSEAQVDSSRLRSSNLQTADWLPIYEASDRLMKLDFAIDDTPALSVIEMRAKARRQMHGCEGKGLVIVDYLQLMQPQNRRSENRQVEIAEISRGLKILAKELDVPVIALSQLSRHVEDRPNKRPVLSDLRESGAIEQDADIVMFIDRSTSEEEAATSGRPDLGVANLIIAKNRNGPTGTVPLSFIDRWTSFVGAARESVAVDAQGNPI